MGRIFILVMVFLFLFCSNLFSHPPASVSLSLIDNNSLVVTVSHPSPNPEQHYVDKIEVKVNGQIVKEKNISAQGGQIFTETLTLPQLKEGDEVTAIAYCNKRGQTEASISVAQQKKNKKKQVIIDDLNIGLQ